MKYNWKVSFKHTRSNGWYTYRYTDWTLVESETADGAANEAKKWVRKYRSVEGWKNRITILEIRKLYTPGLD